MVRNFKMLVLSNFQIINFDLDLGPWSYASYKGNRALHDSIRIIDLQYGSLHPQLQMKYAFVTMILLFIKSVDSRWNQLFHF